MISGSWVRERRFTIPRLLPRRLRSLHTLALVLTLLAIGWLGWLWYKGSSFVRVQRVSVIGLSGPDVPQIRDALTSSALEMTTLNVSISKLEAAVSQYGYVERLMVSGAGAHGLVIHVVEQVPVASVEVGSQSQVVDAGGYLLRSTTIHETLPTVPLKNPPDGQSVTATGARAAIAVLAAAPYALLTHVESATSSSAHGVIVQLRNGPKIYFGPAGQLAQKWTAAIAVLQNKDSSGAAYVDVSDPMHPAAGVGISPSRATALGLASSAITSSSNTVSAGG